MFSYLCVVALHPKYTTENFLVNFDMANKDFGLKIPWRWYNINEFMSVHQQGMIRQNKEKRSFLMRTHKDTYMNLTNTPENFIGCIRNKGFV